MDRYSYVRIDCLFVSRFLVFFFCIEKQIITWCAKKKLTGISLLLVELILIPVLTKWC